MQGMNINKSEKSPQVSALDDMKVSGVKQINISKPKKNHAGRK